MTSRPTELQLEPARPVIQTLQMQTLRGVEIQVEFEEQHTRRPVTLQQIFARMSGQRVAFLRVVKIRRSDYQRVYPSVFQYIRKRLGLPIQNEADLLRRSDAAHLVERAKIQMRIDERLFGKSFVEYVYVGNGTHPLFPANARRLGIATALYAAVADSLARSGGVLYGSPLGNTHSTALWKALESCGYAVRWEEDPFFVGALVPVLDARASRPTRS